MRVGKLLFFWALFLFVFNGLGAWPDSVGSDAETVKDDNIEILTSTIKVLGEKKRIEVVFVKNTGKEEFAKAILKESERYIPKVADFLGIAPSMDVYRITDLTDGSTARNTGETVLVPFNYPDPKKTLNNALLYHEISHWWFGQNPRWISEGVSSFLPIVVSNAGFLPLTKQEKENIESWWGLKKPLHKRDIPLGDEIGELSPSDYNFSIYYEKTFKIHFILYHELGEKRYKQFLLKLLNPDTSIYPFFIQKNVELEGTESILQALVEIKPKNWKSYLSGWLLKKEYKEIPADSFGDSDQDGLIDFLEKIYGTNKNKKDSDGDGVPDGTEVNIGTDPLKKTEANVFKQAFSKVPIILDGSPGEWAFFDDAISVKSPSNPALKGKYDFFEFRYRIADGILYGMIQTRDPIVYNDKEDNGLYIFLIDASDSKEREGVGFWYSPYALGGWEHERKQGTSITTKGSLGEVFEFQIPIQDCPHKVLKLIPILRSTKKPDNIGIWNQYIPIEIKIK